MRKIINRVTSVVVDLLVSVATIAFYAAICAAVVKVFVWVVLW